MVKKINLIIRDLGKVIISIVLIGLYGAMVRGHYALELRMSLLSAFVWFGIATVVYKISNKLTEKKTLPFPLIKILGWLNLVCWWFMGASGLVVACITLGIIKVLPPKESKFFKTLAVIGLFLSAIGTFIIPKTELSGNIILITSLSFLGLYSFVTIFVYKILVVGETKKTTDSSRRSYKNLPQFLIAFLTILGIGVVAFYWFEIRPSDIRQKCSWHSYKVENLNCKTLRSSEFESRRSSLLYGDFFESLIVKCEGMADSYNVVEESYKTRKSTQNEYNFCIKSNGLDH